jgi:hypothetical protein
MALSMDEQRILAEIERKLAADDPALAGSLSAFSRPGLAAGLRTPRSRLLASVIVIAVIALTSLMVYSFAPLRVLAHQSRGPSRPAQKKSELTVPTSQAVPSQAVHSQAVPSQAASKTRTAPSSAQPSALPNATASPAG